MADLYQLIPMSTAQQCVLDNTPRGTTTQQPLTQADGHILAQQVTASSPHPPFRSSIKDGYAVVSTDGPGQYKIVGEVRTGKQAKQISIKSGEVAYITTGAPLPEGADAVVQIEDTQKEPADGQVTINSTASAGQDIRPVGSDISQGEPVVSSGTLITAAEIGLFATVGVREVTVYKRPTVAIMSTGDEVVDADVEELEYGQIRDSNRAMLSSLVTSLGCHVIDLGIQQDDEQSLRNAIARALDQGADVIISSGGVSMGDRDLVKCVLCSLGDMHFGRVFMKPGKPLTFATLRSKHADLPVVPYFGLPGNPVSSFVCFHLVVAPCLRKLMGYTCTLPRKVHVVTDADVALDKSRPEYHRVTLTWRSTPTTGGAFHALSTGNQISSRLLSTTGANALLTLPPGTGSVPAGSIVPALLIGDMRGMPVEGGDAATNDDVILPPNPEAPGFVVQKGAGGGRCRC